MNPRNPGTAPCPHPFRLRNLSGQGRDETAARHAHTGAGHAVDPFLRLDQQHPAEMGKPARPQPFQRRCQMPGQAPADRGHVKCPSGAQGIELTFRQQIMQLRAAVRAAVPERCALIPGPESASCRNHHQQPSLAGHDAPAIPQHGPCMFAVFQRMNKQQPVNGKIGKGQCRLVTQAHPVGGTRRPTADALGRRHHCREPRGLPLKLPEIGNGITQTQHILAPSIRPKSPYPPTNGMAGQVPDSGTVEIIQIDNIHPHGRNYTPHTREKPSRDREDRDGKVAKSGMVSVATGCAPHG